MKVSPPWLGRCVIDLSLIQVVSLAGCALARFQVEGLTGVCFLQFLEMLQGIIWGCEYGLLPSPFGIEASDPTEYV